MRLNKVYIKSWYAVGCSLFVYEHLRTTSTSFTMFFILSTKKCSLAKLHLDDEKCDTFSIAAIQLITPTKWLQKFVSKEIRNNTHTCHMPALCTHNNTKYCRIKTIFQLWCFNFSYFHNFFLSFYFLWIFDELDWILLLFFFMIELLFFCALITYGIKDLRG